MATKDMLMEIEQEVEHHIQCDTIEECFDRVMQTSVSRFGEVLVMSVVEQLWNEYCYESRHQVRVANAYE